MQGNISVHWDWLCEEKSDKSHLFEKEKSRKHINFGVFYTS